MTNNYMKSVFEGLFASALEEYVKCEVDRLPSDGEIVKMYPYSSKHLKKYIRKSNIVTKKTPVWQRNLKRVAIIILVTAVAFFGLMLTNKDVRAAISNAVVTWYNNFIKVDYSNSTDVVNKDKDSVYDFEIGYIPVGFDLVEKVEDNSVREYIYSNSNGDYLSIGIYTADSTDEVIDIEKTEFEKTTINGYETYVLYSEAERSGTVTMGDRNFVVLIDAISDYSDLIKIAENIN